MAITVLLSLILISDSTIAKITTGPTLLDLPTLYTLVNITCVGTGNILFWTIDDHSLTNAIEQYREISVTTTNNISVDVWSSVLTIRALPINDGIRVGCIVFGDSFDSKGTTLRVEGISPIPTENIYFNFYLSQLTWSHPFQNYSLSYHIYIENQHGQLLYNDITEDTSYELYNLTLCDIYTATVIVHSGGYSSNSTIVQSLYSEETYVIIKPEHSVIFNKQKNVSVHFKVIVEGYPKLCNSTLQGITRDNIHGIHKEHTVTDIVNSSEDKESVTVNYNTTNIGPQLYCAFIADIMDSFDHIKAKNESNFTTYHVQGLTLQYYSDNGSVVVECRFAERSTADGCHVIFGESSKGTVNSINMTKSSIEESTVYQYISLPVSGNYTVTAHDIIDDTIISNPSVVYPQILEYILLQPSLVVTTTRTISSNVAIPSILLSTISILTSMEPTSGKTNGSESIAIVVVILSTVTIFIVVFISLGCVCKRKNCWLMFINQDPEKKDANELPGNDDYIVHLTAITDNVKSNSNNNHDEKQSSQELCSLDVEPTIAKIGTINDKPYAQKDIVESTDFVYTFSNTSADNESSSCFVGNKSQSLVTNENNHLTRLLSDLKPYQEEASSNLLQAFNSVSEFTTSHRSYYLPLECVIEDEPESDKKHVIDLSSSELVYTTQTLSVTNCIVACSNIRGVIQIKDNDCDPITHESDAVVLQSLESKTSKFVGKYFAKTSINMMESALTSEYFVKARFLNKWLFSSLYKVSSIFALINVTLLFNNFHPLFYNFSLHQSSFCYENIAFSLGIPCISPLLNGAFMQSKFNCCSFIPFLLLISFAYKLLLACYIYISPPTLFVSQGQLLQNDNMKSDDEQIRLFSLIHELPYPCVLYIIIPDHNGTLTSIDNSPTGPLTNCIGLFLEENKSSGFEELIMFNVKDIAFGSRDHLTPYLLSKQGLQGTTFNPPEWMESQWFERGLEDEIGDYLTFSLAFFLLCMLLILSGDIELNPGPEIDIAQNSYSGKSLSKTTLVNILGYALYSKLFLQSDADNMFGDNKHLILNLSKDNSSHVLMDVTVLFNLLEHLGVIRPNIGYHTFKKDKAGAIKENVKYQPKNEDCEKFQSLLARRQRELIVSLCDRVTLLMSKIREGEKELVLRLKKCPLLSEYRNQLKCSANDIPLLLSEFLDKQAIDESKSCCIKVNLFFTGAPGACKSSLISLFLNHLEAHTELATRCAMERGIKQNKDIIKIIIIGFDQLRVLSYEFCLKQQTLENVCKTSWINIFYSDCRPQLTDISSASVYDNKMYETLTDCTKCLGGKFINGRLLSQSSDLPTTNILLKKAFFCLVVASKNSFKTGRKYVEKSSAFQLLIIKQDSNNNSLEPSLIRELSA